MRRRSRLALPLSTVTLVLLALGAGRVVAVTTTTPDGVKFAQLHERTGSERLHAAERLIRSFYEDGDSSDVLAAAVPEALAMVDRRTLGEEIDDELARPFGDPTVDISRLRDVELVRVSNARVDWCVDVDMRVLVDCQVGVGYLAARVEGAPVTSDGAFLSIHDAYAVLEVLIETRGQPYELRGAFRLDSTTGVPRPVGAPEVLIGTPGGELATVTPGAVIHVPPDRLLVLRFFGAVGIEGQTPGLVDDHVLRWDDGEVHLTVDVVHWFIGLDDSVNA